MKRYKSKDYGLLINRSLKKRLTIKLNYLKRRLYSNPELLKNYSLGVYALVVPTIIIVS
jgi:hypothetical protein